MTPLPLINPQNDLLDQDAYEIAMAFAKDAANRRAQRYGRKTWNQADYNHACRTFRRSWGTASDMAARLRRYGKRAIPAASRKARA